MLVWTYWPEPEGGAERQCRLLAQMLVQKGHSCEIFASRMTGGESNHSLSSNLPAMRRFGFLCPLEKRVRSGVSRLISSAGGDGACWLKALSFWMSVPVVWASRLSFFISLRIYAARVKAPPVDVLHVHDSGWLAGLGVWLGRQWGIPVLCKEATVPALKPVSYGTPFRRTWGGLRREAQGWAALTDYVKQQLIEAGVNEDRIHLIPNGVLVPEKVARAAGRNDFLYVGNLTQGAEWKAFDVLFDAWAMVVRDRPAARLLFVGGGEAAPWKRRLEDAGIASSVSFIGSVSDPSSYYENSGIFVLPSRIEGMSNALLEAQSWGLACVVSDIPGNTAVVSNNENGLVVPVNDAKALSDAMICLLDDQELRQRLGGAARRTAEERFAMPAVAKRLTGVYQDLCSEVRA